MSALIEVTEPILRGRLLTRLLAAQEHAPHHPCGITRRPCPDCRRTAAIECDDPEHCAGASGKPPPGASRLCRPCAATWRCRTWRQLPRRIREYHRAINGFAELAGLDQETGAVLLIAFRRAVHRDLRRILEREFAVIMDFIATR